MSVLRHPLDDDNSASDHRVDLLGAVAGVDERCKKRPPIRKRRLTPSWCKIEQLKLADLKHRFD